MTYFGLLMIFVGVWCAAEAYENFGMMNSLASRETKKRRLYKLQYHLFAIASFLLIMVGAGFVIEGGL